MIKLALTASSLAFALGAAPIQCRRSAGEEVAHEESPGDALYALAEDFRAKGNDAAAKETLRRLVERYPSNRHAPAARVELTQIDASQ